MVSRETSKWNLLMKNDLYAIAIFYVLIKSWKLKNSCVSRETGK